MFCEDEFSGEEKDTELDKESLLGSRGENSSSIPLSDVSDVHVPDKSASEVMTMLRPDPDIKTVRASVPVKPNGKKEQSETPIQKRTLVVKMPSLPTPCKITKSAPEKEKREVVIFQCTPHNPKSNKSFPSSVPGISMSKLSTITCPPPP